MKIYCRLIVSILLIAAFITNAVPCGPGYVSPVFDYKKAPENPYENFAAGRLGIVKTTMNRSVLYAAYRYINGGSFNAEEQKALVDVWKADFDNKNYIDDSIEEAVKAWVEKRKGIVGKEEKIPEIYVERNYGGYDFFPNCTRNAFEVAAETLSSRSTSYGSDNKDVKAWVAAQDQVFQNCSEGKDTPEAANAGMPEWLQKDRAYQIAAAEFYSLDYNEAKRRFAEIALDGDSPWQETADYLVARTLIRQASLSKTEDAAKPFYAEAEQQLQRFVSRSGKFSESSERLLGLVKFRLHPAERVQELGHSLAFQGGSNFRQDLIDYTWLMDKFEKETLEAEEKKKLEVAPVVSAANMANAPANTADPAKNEGDLELTIYSTDYSTNWKIYLPPNATDDDAIAEAVKVIGGQMTDEMKKRVREARKSAYTGRFDRGRQEEYPGTYYGSEPTSLSILPQFIRSEDLTDWLFTYQINNAEAYLYSLSRFRSSSSDLWLMTALTKAEKSSTELPAVLEAAGRVSRTSLAYPTIAYHSARIYLELGKTAEARKILDEILNNTTELPISTVNQFLDLRLKIADTMEDYLRSSLRKPFAFDISGSTGTIDQFIAEAKEGYDPQYNKDGKEAFDREVEDRFKEEKTWQDRLMFDAPVIDVMNKHFPQTVLLEAEKSPAIPDYLRERFAFAIWMRAVLLGDLATQEKLAPALAKYKPQFAEQIEVISAAKTPAARESALLFFILKNPVLTPYLEDGMGKVDNEFDPWGGDDWWCEPYEESYDESTETTGPSPLPPRPKFLTAAQSRTAQEERKKLKEIGDAPKYLAGKVLEWAKRSPADKRIPESLYIVHGATGWTKYGCGNNDVLHHQIGELLKNKYGASEWARQLIADESGDQ